MSETTDERWRVDVVHDPRYHRGGEGFFLEAPDGTCWGLNKFYSHPEKLPAYLNRDHNEARTDKALAGLAREARELGPHFQGCHANPGNHWAAERCTCGWTDWLARFDAITRDAPKESCHASNDGDCSWADCPQLKDYQQWCPLATRGEGRAGG